MDELKNYLCNGGVVRCPWGSWVPQTTARDVATRTCGVCGRAQLRSVPPGYGMDRTGRLYPREAVDDMLDEMWDGAE